MYNNAHIFIIIYFVQVQAYMYNNVHVTWPAYRRGGLIMPPCSALLWKRNDRFATGRFATISACPIHIHSHNGSTYLVKNGEWRNRWSCLLTKPVNFLWALSLFTLHVSSLSPSMPSLKTALVRQGFIKNDTSVCRLICVASWRPCSTTNEGEVWAQQRSKKSAGLRPSVLTIKHN